jgi:hypothetical protein
MGVNEFVIYDSDYNTIMSYYGYSDYGTYDYNTCTLVAGETYYFEWRGGDYYGYWYYYGYDWALYPQMVAFYLDANGDYSFDTSTETIWQSGYYDNYHSGSFTIPADGSSGYRRLRIYNTYGYWYNWIDPCNYNYYGSYVDFDVMAQYVIQNDAGIITMKSPVDNFDSYQPQDFVCTMKNFSENTLESCTIYWTLDGNYQTPIYWSGSLAKDEMEDIVLASSYTYTPYDPWDPMHVEVWTDSPQGNNYEANSYPDANSANDRITADIKPLLNDAGFLNADDMIPISAGSNDVKLRIKNFAPKPLSSVTIDWKVDGVQQTTFYATFNPPIGPGEEAVVIVGQYFFGAGNQAYLIEAKTSNPNGLPDENPANDGNKSEVYKALPGGVYTIGQYESDFVSVQEAIEFISFWGIGGPVTFLIRPGQYLCDFQVDFKSRRQFPLTFESITRRALDVVLYNDGTNDKNYLFDLVGYDDIIFRSLTFEVRNSLYPDIFYFQNGNKNLLFDKCVFNALSNIGIVMNISYDIEGLEVSNCTFNNGERHITNMSDAMIQNIWIHDNEFNFSSFLFLSFNDDASGSVMGLNVENNVFNGNNTSWGIFCSNAMNVNISNNRFDGLNAYYNSGYGAGIRLTTGGGYNNLVQNDSRITGNTITCVNADGINVSGDNCLISENNINAVGANSGLSWWAGIFGYGTGHQINKNTIYVNNMTGIFAMGYDGEVSYNDVNGENSWEVENAGIFLNDYHDSYVADNEATVSGMFGILQNSNSHVSLVYNSILNKSDWPAYGFNTQNQGGIPPESTMVNVQRPTMQSKSSLVSDRVPVTAEFGKYKDKELGGSTGNIELYRNIFMNNAGGIAALLFDDGFIRPDFNNWWTNGPTLMVLNGTDYPTLADYQGGSGLDLNSVSVEAKFLSPTDLHLVEVNDLLYSTNQMYFGSDHDNYENMDLGKRERAKTYYMGAYSIVPTIEMAKEPEDVVDCYGTTSHSFTVVANVDFGAIMSYQWFKDNQAIFGATGPILYINQPLDYEMGAVYQCRISANGEADPIWSRPALLYTMRPTEITRQPGNVRNDLGDIASFEIDMHIYNEAPSLYQPKIQWYRAGQKLTDNDRLAGTTSSIMTIRDIQPEDLGDDYSVIITGLCGSDTSKIISLTQVPKLAVEDMPGNVEVCVGEDIALSVVATSNIPGVVITYNWVKDGILLVDDAKISGANTANLVIKEAKAGDEGLYSCLVTLEQYDKKFSNQVDVKINDKPVIVKDLEPSAVFQVGKTLELKIDASGADLTYQWYLNNAEIPGETDATYTKDNIQTLDEGTYKVRVTNICGEIYSNECVVSITPFIILGNDDAVAGEYILNQNSPNPFAGATEIGFILPEASHAKLAITDLYGRELAVIADKAMTAGLNRFTVNSNEMNLNSGVYFYTLTVNGKSITKTMVIVK